ncbi:hypothetical protein [Geodermatophilus sp. URMC 63]
MTRQSNSGAVTRTLLFMLGIVVLGGVVTLLIRAEARPSTTVASFDQGLQLSFGLSREAISRTLRLDLCESEQLRDSAECSDEGSDVPRPEILSAALRGDLISGAGNQFPAAQFGVSASNVGRSGLVVNVNANPTTPNDIGPGVYEGQVVIDRSVGPAITLPVTATLLSRSGVVAWKAGTALAVGALAGTLVKWLEDTFSPLAALRRRQRGVWSRLLPHREVLPTTAKNRLDEAQGYIASYSLEEAGEPVQQLHDHQDSLLIFADAAEALREGMDTQRRIMKADPRLQFADAALVAEAEFLDDVRARPWPWKEPDTVLQELLTVRRFAGRLANVLRQAANQGPESLPAKQLESWIDRLAKGQTIGQVLADMSKVDGQPADASRQASWAGISGTVTSSDIAETAGHDSQTKASDRQPAATRRELRRRDRRRPSLWLLDNAWWLTLFFVASIVTFVGFQSEFIDNTSFEGDAADYVQLIAWSLAVQVAGGTIIETIGRLRTSRAGFGA